MPVPSKNPYGDLSELDPSHRASRHLSELIAHGEDHEDIVILDDRLKSSSPRDDVSPQHEEQNAPPPTEVAEAVPEVRAETARTAAPILDAVTERNNVRMLVITQHTAYGELGSLAQRKLLELSRLFAEIHVVMLTVEGDYDVAPMVRLADNVWLYATESFSWWKTGWDAYALAHEQLVFAGGFRADIIVAEDPFESGVAGYLLARKHERPLQVHVREDIYDEGFTDADPHTFIHQYVARFVLRHTDCVRTSSDYVRMKVLEKHPSLEVHTETLPLYYNLETWRDTVPTVDLHTLYPRFKFFILHVSSMHAKSHTTEVIHGALPLLRMYPTVGLVIIGNGPYRAHFEKLVLSLGVHTQVEFIPMSDDVVSYMKSAHVLVHISEDQEEDVYVLQAAAVKLPIIASTQNIAGTLFTHTESAFLCERADPACVSYFLKSFLNDNLARTRFAITAQEVVFTRIEQDYTLYLEQYRSSIERCI